ncbi:MAG: toll/interleukin-1 receptor domain-containing protein [Muribaculaceae bacterium]|nr:toll/interleukin-1 receptor domain-containing protein [Muribaculaceae bacterium]
MDLNHTLRTAKQALLNELDSLIIEAHNYLESRAKTCKRWSEFFSLIQKDYPEWMRSKFLEISDHYDIVFSQFTESKEIIIHIEPIVFSLKRRCKITTVPPLCSDIHETGYIDDIIERIDKNTRESIDKTSSLLSEKIDLIIDEHQGQRNGHNWNRTPSTADESDTHMARPVRKYSPSNHKANSRIPDCCPPIIHPNSEPEKENLISYSATSGGEFESTENVIDSPSDSPTKVNSAVYAPSEVNRNEYAIIQIYIYKPSEETKVEKVAYEIDSDATRRNYIPLSSMIKPGDNIKLLFRCYSKKIELEESSIEGIWMDEMFKHEFVAYIPEDFNSSNFICGINLLINDIPVGDMKFKINVVDSKPRKIWAEIKSEGYRKSFISYSHADAEKVRFLAEGFRIQGIDYFFDEHSLRTGDNFPKEIEEYISSCDVFVLCWSENAKSSDWVRRECNMALQRYNSESDKFKIYPISIIPRADLPLSLQEKFHFGTIE